MLQFDEKLAENTFLKLFIHEIDSFFQNAVISWKNMQKT